MSHNKNHDRPRKGINYSIISGIVIAALAILSIVGIFQYKRANDLEESVNNGYIRSFTDMVDYMGNIEVSLKKAMLASNPTQLSSISSDIYMKAAAAKSNLSQLPTNDINLENTSKFLSQVGDYTAYLSAKTIDSGGVLSDDDFTTLNELSVSATSIHDSLEGMLTQFYNGELKFTQNLRKTAEAAEEEQADDPSFGGGMEEIEKQMQDYPTLIYDGPFSEHIQNMEPEMLKDKQEVTQEQARAMVEYFIGERAANTELSGEGNGTIKTYSFTSTPDERSERRISTEVTKIEGLVLWMLDNRSVDEENLSVDDAMEKGSEFLKNMGYMGMKQSYYDKSNNVATINYAYTENNVTIYSDLIKVKVALDNGEIVGFESNGYIMSHKKRAIPTTLLTESDAKSYVTSNLNIDAVKLALIPLESKREVLCYEFKGSFHDQNFLIYLNAQTGKEEKILMLIESDEGILTE